MAVLGVDTGGTFTDFYLVADDGSVTIHKRPATPGEPARAILDGLAEMAVTPDELVHGTTVATNAIIERRGARTALITTRGFRDTLVIGRQTRPKLYDLSPHRPPPLVPEDLRLEANERLDHHGDVLEPIDATEVETLLDRLEAAGIESLAVCFLFSFLNPEHERVVAAAARLRGIPTSVSHEVLPEHREYERTSTTVANACVAPVISRYLTRLSAGLAGRGVARLRIMASNGGCMSAQAAGRLAVRTAVSGPAGGVAGAIALAQQAGYQRIITLDMGGTSTDVSLCPGAVLERDETAVGDLPIRGPTIDVISVGAGGGSLVRLDEGGILRVGPESAGADPGPACYGLGARPTVTDAHVALGRIAPQHFLGGRMAIDVDRSTEALRSIAEPFGGDPHLAAGSIVRVANAHMESALRRVSVERGHDPREFTLVAFGGAGPLHACGLAAALHIPRVLIPPHPGVLSALGMATAPIVKDVSTTLMLRLGGDTFVARLAHAHSELEHRGRAEFEAEGFALAGLAVQTFLQMRYVGQSYELPVRVDPLDPGAFIPAFHVAHQQRYGHSDPSRAVEIVTLRIKLLLPSLTAPSPPQSRPTRKRSTNPNPDEYRDVWFANGPTQTPIYDRRRVARGARITAPAVVMQMDSTTVVPPGWQAEVDAFRNLILEPV